MDEQKKFEKEIENRICEVWEIVGSVVYLPLEFQQTQGPVATIPERYDSNGRLHVKILYSTRNRDTLLHHEGAHVFLFDLLYPPAHPNRVDFVNEYYAYKLELERRFNGDQEKFEELLGDLGTKRIELEALFGGVGQAIAAKLREHWGLGGKPSNYVFPFGETYDCLEHAPEPPELPRRAKPFTLDQRNEIKELLRESFPRIYSGGQIQFLETPD